MKKHLAIFGGMAGLVVVAGCVFIVLVSGCGNSVAQQEK